MNDALHRLASDVRLGRAHNYWDIRFGFTTPDGRPAQEAEMEAPGEDEDFIGRAELEVSARVGGQEEPSPLGRLVVTALAPGQGTGKTGPGPDGRRTAGIVPVSREGVHTKLHVPISTLVPDSTFMPDRTVIRAHPFVNHLRLKGVQDTGDDRHIITLGAVGQNPDFFKRVIEGEEQGAPPHPAFTLVSGLQHGERLALFNATEATQLAGMLALYEQPTDDPDDFMRNIVASQPMPIGTERVAIVRSGRTDAPHPETLDIPPAPVASR